MDTQDQQTVTIDGARIPASLWRRDARNAVRVAVSARALDHARSAWLNPPEWTASMDGTPGKNMPERFKPLPGFEDKVTQRTLTNLYNERPAWLTELHLSLDASVAAAYGWSDYTPEMTDDEVLSRLLVLNKLPREKSLL